MRKLYMVAGPVVLMLLLELFIGQATLHFHYYYACECAGMVEIVHYIHDAFAIKLAKLHSANVIWHCIAFSVSVTDQ